MRFPKESILYSPVDPPSGPDSGINYIKFLEEHATEDVLDIRNGLLTAVGTYRPQTDVDEIQEAYDIAYYYHKKAKQLRGTESEKEGTRQQKGQFQEYMVHPGAVAQILADWRCDRATIIGGLLHDTLEDTDLKYNPDFIRRFGDEVFTSVINSSKVTSLTPVTDLTPREIKDRNLAKFLTAFYEDPRSILIKLADRLHNMRTIAGLTEGKREDFLRETIEIFIPIARIVGMHNVADDMLEIAYRALWPKEVEEVESKIEERYITAHIDPILDPVRQAGVYIKVEKPKFFDFISHVDGKIMDLNIFPVRIICWDTEKFKENVKYFQVRMQTVDLEENSSDGRTEFLFGFSDMDLAISIFDWEGYLWSDSSLISRYQLQPVDSDIFQFNESEKAQFLKKRQEYAETKLFKPQQRIRQYYERKKEAEARVGLISPSEALQTIQTPLIFVSYNDGNKVKLYVLSAGDTAWELVFTDDPDTAIRAKSVMIHNQRKSAPLSQVLIEGDLVEKVNLAKKWTINVYTLSLLKDPISKGLVRENLQMILRAAQTYISTEDNSKKKQILEDIETSGIGSGEELVETADRWRAQAEDIGEENLKKIYQELYTLFYQQRHGNSPLNVREEPIVTLNKGWEFIQKEIKRNYKNITDFEIQCGLELVERDDMIDYVRAVWEYEDRLTQLSLTLPNKEGALARIAAVAMVYGNIEDLDVARNIEGVEVDQVIFSFRIETESEKSARELKRILRMMSDQMIKPDFQLDDSESISLDIRLSSGFSIIPYLGLLESHGLTVDSFNRKGDFVRLVVRRLSAVEQQMEITRDGLNKLVRKLEAEKAKIVKARMMQIPPVEKSETELYIRREKREKDRFRFD